MSGLSSSIRVRRVIYNDMRNCNSTEAISLNNVQLLAHNAPNVLQLTNAAFLIGVKQVYSA